MIFSRNSCAAVLLGVGALGFFVIPEAKALIYSAEVEFEDDINQNRGAGIFKFSINYNGQAPSERGSGSAEFSHRWGVNEDYSTNVGNPNPQTADAEVRFQNFDLAYSSTPVGPPQTRSQLGTLVPPYTGPNPIVIPVPTENVLLNGYIVRNRSATDLDIYLICESGDLACDKRTLQTGNGYNMPITLRKVGGGTGSWLTPSDLPLDFTVLSKTQTNSGNNAHFCNNVGGSSLATNSCNPGGENNRIEFDTINKVTPNVKEVPGPLPVFGASLSFLYARKIRKRIRLSA